MASTPAASLERACSRRFPAWTLYARAVSGSRAVADDLVRRAIDSVRGSVATDSSEFAVHGRVLRAIRDEGLADASPGVLGSIRSGYDEATRTARAAIRRLPRLERRALALQLLRRPALSEAEAARKLRVSTAAVSEAFDRGLDELAAVLRGRRRGGAVATIHPARATLVTYVSGALSGDEAREVADHASSCARCGDVLGVLMLLKAGASESARTPWLSRGQRRLVVTVFAAVAVAASALVANALWPNPWAAYATKESVPEWFHAFFYGEGRDDATGATARGLELLVNGALPEAIETLSPEAAGPGGSTEAAAYLGIARYLSGKRSRATVRLLQRGTESTRAGRLSRWYLASALLARRDPEGAKRQLEALATTQDWFGRRASELLDQLESADVEPSGLAA